MNSPSTGSRSVWMTTVLPKFPILQEKLETDVCVIGGGIAGLTTAYLLSREGKSGVLIDALEIGDGEPGRTQAHVIPTHTRSFETDTALRRVRARLVRKG